MALNGTYLARAREVLQRRREENEREREREHVVVYAARKDYKRGVEGDEPAGEIHCAAAKPEAAEQPV